MLTRSFCCFRGVSSEAEQHLWRAGCLSWRHLKLDAARLFSAKKAQRLLDALPLFEAAFEAKVADFFLTRLPCGHRLRVFPAFAELAAYLDIETTGLGRRSAVTVIGLAQGGEVRTYVRGQNLHDFVRVWPHLGVVMTFNGTRFDLPVLMREFGFSTHPPHIDLMAESRAHGFGGGLKAIEYALGVTRQAEEAGTGEEAAQMWARYATTGDDADLKRLIAYNTRDVLSLRSLAKKVWALSTQNYSAPHDGF